MNKVLILDAHTRAALASIRSLGKKDITVDCASEKDFPIGFFSKYCDRRVACHDPRSHPELFVKELMNILGKDTYECVIPNSTPSAFVLAKYYKTLSEYTHVASPNFEVFLQAYDKKRVIEKAEELGITCPKTYDFDVLKNDTGCSNQLVIKPRTLHGSGIIICNSGEELCEYYSKMTEVFGPCYVQEFIPNGGELGVYVLLNNESELRAVTLQRRIRSISPYGGISTFRETIKYDSQLVDISLKLLQSIHWVGPAMVEFRIDANDNIPKFIEMNPRFWGSLQLSINAGVDFPYLLYKMVTEGDIKSQLTYRENVRCRWLFGDFTNFLLTPNKMKNLYDFLKINTNYDIESLDDPWPMIINPLMILRYSPKRDKRTIKTIASIYHL
jgi:predicted ATP-grasp superfamily ATP-dependent carboligase